MNLSSVGGHVFCNDVFGNDMHFSTSPGQIGHLNLPHLFHETETRKLAKRFLK
jgi:hypothetical protein